MFENTDMALSDSEGKDEFAWMHRRSEVCIKAVAREMEQLSKWATEHRSGVAGSEAAFANFASGLQQQLEAALDRLSRGQWSIPENSWFTREVKRALYEGGVADLADVLSLHVLSLENLAYNPREPWEDFANDCCDLRHPGKEILVITVASILKFLGWSLEQFANKCNDGEHRTNRQSVYANLTDPERWPRTSTLSAWATGLTPERRTIATRRLDT